MYKHTVFYFSLAFFILLAISPVSAYSRIHGMWITHIVVFTVLAILVKRKKIISGKILAGFLFGTFLFFVDYIIDGFDFSDFGLFELLLPFSYMVAVSNGYIFAKAGNIKSRVTIVLVSGLFCIVNVFYLADKFLHYENYGNFTGIVNEDISPTLLYINKAGDTVNVNQDDDKLYVLDFWTTTCGYCFKQFPVLDSLYNKYKADSGIIIAAVNIPQLSDTPGIAMNIISQYNYTFPVGIGIDSLDVRAGVYTYSAVVAVKNGKMIYKGSISYVNKLIEEELNNK